MVRGLNTVTKVVGKDKVDGGELNVKCLAVSVKVLPYIER